MNPSLDIYKQNLGDKGREIKGGWAPVRVCECCGKFIVLLKLPAFGSKTDNRWYKTVYFKGWDGNPWYLGPMMYGGNAQPHSTKKFAAKRAEERGPVEPMPLQDPFFSLD